MILNIAFQSKDVMPIGLIKTEIRMNYYICSTQVENLEI